MHVPPWAVASGAHCALVKLPVMWPAAVPENVMSNVPAYPLASTRVSVTLPPVALSP